MKESTFRDALGCFATGVTIVTTKNGQGKPVGLTVNSFNSVSLSPPMILWSLSKSSKNLESFSDGQYFAVHVMASDQVEISKRFAQRGVEKFSGLEFSDSEVGTPIIPGCSAVFQCELRHQYEGGDHVIFVGQVIQFDTTEKPPLLFHKGAFHSGDVIQSDESETSDVISNQIGFTEDFFPYLMARAHFQLSLPLKSVTEKYHINEDDYFVLLLLTLGDGRTTENLSNCLEHTSHYPTQEKIADMHERGLIHIKTCEGCDKIFISKKGLTLTGELLSASKLVEQKLRNHFVSSEVDSLKRMLKRIILRTDPGVPDLWDVKDH